MNAEAETALMIRGAIASLSPEEEGRVKQAYAAILAVEEKYPGAAQMAIAWRGSELAAQE